LKQLIAKDSRRLYGDMAWLWPIISPFTDYIEETELFSRKIREHVKKKDGNLLHLGCGGGHNDYIFKKYFEVTGVDISESMLALASKLNPEVTYMKGDMRSLRLPQSFDAVTVLDSINYMTSVEDLYSAFRTAYVHLAPGGVFLTLIEQISGKFQQNYCKCSTHSKGDVEVSFIENYYDPDIGDTSYEATFIYLIRKAGELENLPR